MSESEAERDETTAFSEERVNEWLKDPKKKELLIKKLGIGDSANDRTSAALPTKGAVVGRKALLMKVQTST